MDQERRAFQPKMNESPQATSLDGIMLSGAAVPASVPLGPNTDLTEIAIQDLEFCPDWPPGGVSAGGPWTPT